VPPPPPQDQDDEDDDNQNPPMPDISGDIQIIKGFNLFTEEQENQYMQKIKETDDDFFEKRQKKIDMFLDETRNTIYRPVSAVIKRFNLGFYVQKYNPAYWTSLTS
jgi:patatin-like phospholipase/acyl hydrolase